MKIGVLGGTFDPIHIGHIRLAEEVGDDLALEKVYLIPSASPPHKGGRVDTPFCHRLAMARLAVKGSPLLDVMDLEGKRRGLSYSIETLREIHLMFPSELDLFFLIGMDAFLEIKTWKDYRNLFNYTHFVVIRRPGIQTDALDRFILALDTGFKERADGLGYVNASGNQLICPDASLIDISSTEIRRKVALGRSIRLLVPEDVNNYILEKGLYKVHGDAGQSAIMP